MDYYNILGVNKNASQEDIKKAYRKLAMRHHPDKGGDQKTFQRINEAYDVLKDPQRRKQYDTPQPQWQRHQWQDINTSNMDDIFSSFFGQRTQVRRNKDIKIAYDLTLEDVAKGKDMLVAYRMLNGQEATATIRIHPGVQNGEVIRFTGLGDNSHPQLHRGDLLVLCRVKAHKVFERDRHHLKLTLNINVFELVTGTTKTIQSLTGAPLRVNIPKSTNPGTILSIAGYGLPEPRTGRTGNLYVHIKGIIPQLNDDQIQRIKNINDELSSST